MDQEALGKELQRFNVTDAAIAKLNTDYMALTVKDANDSPGYEVCKKARIDIKKRRVEVEKTRVQLKAESLEYGRRVDGEAKRITALLAPIEDHLISQEKIVDDEKARLLAESEAKEAARVQARIDRLESMGMGLIAGHYKLPYGAEGVAVPVAILKICKDEQFEQFVAQIQEKKDAEDARLKAEEEDRKAEGERLAKVAAEQEAERLRLAEVARKQAEEAEKIKAEQIEIERVHLRAIAEEERKARIKDRLESEEREKKEKAIRDEDERVRKEKEEWEAIKAQEARDIAAAKQKVIDDIRHLQDIETAKKVASERAKIETEAKIKREAEEKAAKEAAAKIAAEKKAARAPDKVKILIVADVLDSIQTPDVKTEDGKAVALSVMMSIAELIKTIRDKAEAL